MPITPTTTNVDLVINRVPSLDILKQMESAGQLQPNQLYTIPSKIGDGLVALQTKVLWTNPNPTSSFPAQTITVEDMSEFDYILYLFNTNTTSSENGGLSYISPNGKGCYCSWSYGNTSHSRECNYISSTQIQFTNGVTNTSNDNKMCIPTKIYGLKIVPASDSSGGGGNNYGWVSLNNYYIANEVISSTYVTVDFSSIIPDYVEGAEYEILISSILISGKGEPGRVYIKTDILTQEFSFSQIQDGNIQYKNVSPIPLKKYFYWKTLNIAENFQWITALAYRRIK